MDINSDLFGDRSFFRLTVDSVYNHVVITNAEGQIVYANAAAERMTGYSFSEMKGSTPSIWGKQMDAAFYQEMWRQIKIEQKPFHAEIKNKRKNGVLYYAITTITPLVEQGDLKGYVGIEEDISPLKQLDQAKDEFLSIASHELRTPLAAIDGIVSLLLDGDYGSLPTDVRTALKDVESSSLRLIDLVNDLLNLSRIQSGRLKYTLQDTDIFPSVEECERLFRALFDEKKVAFIVDKESCRILADLDKVKQILTNLLSNALKFTDNGSVRVRVFQDSDMVYVQVADSGCGISASDQEKLFGKFQQVGPLSNQNKGTGLGLHVSREMARKMGGDLVILSSVVGEGSVFQLSLPISKEAQGKVEVIV